MVVSDLRLIKICFINMKSKLFTKIISKIISNGLAGVIGILQIVLEQVIENEVFRCPCNYILWKKVIYFILLLIVPSLLFLFVGFSINLNFWKLIVGCKSSQLFDRNRETTNKECCGYPSNYCRDTFCFALIFPAFWLILILIDGDYLACTFEEKLNDISKNQICSQVSLLSLFTKFIELI